MPDQVTGESLYWQSLSCEQKKSLRREDFVEEHCDGVLFLWWKTQELADSFSASRIKLVQQEENETLPASGP